jgi:cytidyltransferase-like protein
LKNGSLSFTKSMKKKRKKIIVATCGGFDPVHIGHTRLFQEAKALGDELVVILNNDNWLLQKKGYVFMPEKERKEILESFKWIDKVVLTNHAKNPKDMSVCAELAKVKPDIFTKGGDRTQKDADNKLSSLNPEQTLCQKMGIKMVFGIGRGGKIQSSSWLVNKFLNKSI